MTYDDVIAFYGSASRAADKLNVTRAAVSLWKRDGIPLGRQARVQILTRGRLKADPLNPPQPQTERQTA